MGAWNNFKSFWDKVGKRLLPDRHAEVLGVGKVQEDKRSRIVDWFFNPMIGQPRNISISKIRSYGESNYVRVCINSIINEIIGMDWVVKPREELGSYDKARLLEVEEFFRFPNKDDDFKTFLKKLLEDILVIDAGVIVKTFNQSGSYEKSYSYELNKDYSEDGAEDFATIPVMDDAKLYEMSVADGGSFLVQTDVHGRLYEERPTFFQYSYSKPMGSPMPFFKREISYFKLHPVTYSFYGRSPIQWILNELSFLMNSTRHNQKYFEDFAMPSGIVSVPGMEANELTALRESWRNLRGQPYKTIFVNSKDLDFKQMSISNRDMQWLDGQKYYQKLVWAAFGVTQNEVGFTEDLKGMGGGKASEVQDRIFLRKAIFPIIQLLESRFNSDIVPEFYGDKDFVEAEFSFLTQDLFAEQLEEDRWTQWISDNRRTVNEWRAEKGLDGVEWGDEPVKTSFGMPFNQGFEEEESGSKSVLTKSVSVNPNEFANFLEDYYSGIEKKVLAAIKRFKISGEVIKCVKSNKSLGSFVRSLIMLFNGAKLNKEVRNVVKTEFVKGITEAEKQTGVQIGFQEKYAPIIDNLSKEEIDGYVLPDGTQWFGINGVNEDLKRRIHQSVMDGLNSEEDLKQISARVKNIFGDAKGWEAMRIARTESNRLANLGAVKGYADSGVRGKKVWLSTKDSRTSDICRRLDGQKALPHEAFTDPGTGKQFLAPPSHPNCFLEGTMVTTDKGKKDIKKVVVGDKVITHKNRVREVTGTMSRLSDSYYEVVINGRKLKVTGEHPVLTNRGWVQVKDLRVNDWVVSR